MLLLFLTLACASAPSLHLLRWVRPRLPRWSARSSRSSLRPGDRDAGITGRCADGQVVSFLDRTAPTRVLQLDVPATARVARDPVAL